MPVAHPALLLSSRTPIRSQLVYACGAARALPAIRERAVAMQAILHLVSELIDSSQSDPCGSSGGPSDQNIQPDLDAIWVPKSARLVRVCLGFGLL